MNVSLFRTVVGVVLGWHAATAWAQSGGEPTDAAAQQVAVDAAAHDRPATRLGLRMAIDARQRGAPTGHDVSDYHRLTSEQRQELREQVRRASMRFEEPAAGESVPKP